MFMGTPAFSIPVLEALLGAGHSVVGVYTQPDKPRGRGRVAEAPAIKSYAISKGLPVFQSVSLKAEEVQAQLRGLAPQAIVVAAYGKLLPLPVLKIPPFGCLNVHPSLLPKYRGASPVASAILEGDSRAGVTIILMDEGMDSGPILLQEEEEIRDEDTAESLTGRLFVAGARLVVAALAKLEKGDLQPIPQDGAQATFTRLLTKEEGELDFAREALQLWRQVRAHHPWPGSYTYWQGKLLKVQEARPLPAIEGKPAGLVVPVWGEPGTPIAVVTGKGLLGLRRVQLEGKSPVGAEEFLRGYRGILGAALPD